MAESSEALESRQFINSKKVRRSTLPALPFIVHSGAWQFLLDSSPDSTPVPESGETGSTETRHAKGIEPR